eukprot:293154-Pelagomonas_calceolata.AAC.2
MKEHETCKLKGRTLLCAWLTKLHISPVFGGGPVLNSMRRSHVMPEGDNYPPPKTDVSRMPTQGDGPNLGHCSLVAKCFMVAKCSF